MEKDKKGNTVFIDEVSHVIVPKECVKEKTIECEVCGYENPNGTKICKNCSNYLA